MVGTERIKFWQQSDENAQWHSVSSQCVWHLLKLLTMWPHTAADRLQLKCVAHGDAREGKWRWNWRMEWVASTLHNNLEQGVSSITRADAHTSAASSRLNWRTCQFKWTRPFRWKTKSGFCACAIIFKLASTYLNQVYCIGTREVSLFACIRKVLDLNFGSQGDCLHDIHHFPLFLQTNGTIVL